MSVTPAICIQHNFLMEVPTATGNICYRVTFPFPLHKKVWNFHLRSTSKRGECKSHALSRDWDPHYVLLYQLFVILLHLWCSKWGFAISGHLLRRRCTFSPMPAWKSLTLSLTLAYLGLMTYVKQTDVRSRTIGLWSEPMGVEQNKYLPVLLRQSSFIFNIETWANRSEIIP